jgi:hypothetical protein
LFFPDLRQIGEELHAIIKKLILEELNGSKQQQVDFPSLPLPGSG